MGGRSLLRQSRGVLKALWVWDVAVWSGRADFDTGGIYYKGSTD